MRNGELIFCTARWFLPSAYSFPIANTLPICLTNCDEIDKIMPVLFATLD
jgi:hypothetical protein